MSWIVINVVLIATITALLLITNSALLKKDSNQRLLLLIAQKRLIILQSRKAMMRSHSQMSPEHHSDHCYAASADAHYLSLKTIRDIYTWRHF